MTNKPTSIPEMIPRSALGTSVALLFIIILVLVLVLILVAQICPI
jgi:hypothetical protein